MNNINRIISGILFFSLLISGCAYYNTLFNAKKSYKLGIKAMEGIRRQTTQNRGSNSAQKYFETTIEKSWKLIEIYSDKSKYADDALLYIAKSEYYLNRFTEARLHLEQFQKKYANSDLIPESNLWFGKVYEKLGSEGKASEYLQQVINSSGKNYLKAQAFFELGKNSYEKSEFEDAITYFQKALKEKSDDEYRALLQFYLGESFFYQNQYEAAIKAFKRVEKYSPTIETEVETQLHLAQANEALGKQNEALVTLKKMLTAVRFQNFVPRIKNSLAKIYIALGQPEEAEDIYKEVLRNPKTLPDKEISALELARLYENTYGEIDSALVYYAAVRRINPRSDSIAVAEKRRKFLQEYYDLQTAISRDTRLVFRLENEADFRDSLYSAQKEDSLREILRKEGRLPEQKQKEYQDLLLKIAKEDSLEKVRQDSIKQAILNNSGTQQTQNQSGNTSGSFGFNSAESKIPGANPKGNSVFGTRKELKPRVEKRKLNQIKTDLKENIFHKAEFFLLKAQDYDSAAYYYRKFAQEYNDSTLTPKSLYSLMYIYSLPDYNDSVMVKEYREEILAKYPTSIFAKQMLNKDQKPEAEQNDVLRVDPAREAFEKAEALYFAGNFEEALPLYESVANEFKDSQWGAKAQYAVAWIYENKLKNTGKAVQNYEKIIENFAEFPQYVSIARQKTAKPVIKKKVTKSVNDQFKSGKAHPDLPKQENLSSQNLKDGSFEAKKLWRKRRSRSSNFNNLKR